jgi:FtsZ-binding cell division protein ZapB
MQRNAGLSQEITRLKLENEKLQSERQSVEASFGQKEVEVRDRLKSLLNQVEQVELQMN